jgi:hypothetical protein
LKPLSFTIGDRRLTHFVAKYSETVFVAPEDKSYPVLKVLFCHLSVLYLSNRMFVDQKNVQILFKMAYIKEPISAVLGTGILNF